MISVLVVDDSAFMRRWLSDKINEQSDMRVVGTARNGRVAVEFLTSRDEEVDVVTLDIEMPVLDGLSALKIMMKQAPTPVIMVSSMTERGAAITLEAMHEGAVDVVLKPSGSISLDMDLVHDDLIQKVRQAATVDVKKLQKSSLLPDLPSNLVDPVSATGKKLIAIGTSTGGPKALQSVLTQLPETFDCPIVVVQHMPAHFTRTFAERLNHISKLTVKEAEHDERLKAGHVYIAPGDEHMTVHERYEDEYRIHLDRTSHKNELHRPSVNRLFHSLAHVKSCHVIAVVLTGMGADGSEGLKALKREGRCTAIAEAKDSAVVFGMPKVIINEGLADYILLLREIPKHLMKIGKKE